MLSQQNLCSSGTRTTSIFVGRYFIVCVLDLHGSYKYDLIEQVLDTPGILDHPLEERNTIEMQVT